jgi:predicted HAD superfamily Cof-like phosphohydrolase
MAVAFGLPLQVAFTRVHKSNMSKLGADGKPIYRDDGKVLKGPNYAPVDLEDLVEGNQVPGYEYFGVPV